MFNESVVTISKIAKVIFKLVERKGKIINPGILFKANWGINPSDKEKYFHQNQRWIFKAFSYQFKQRKVTWTSLIYTNVFGLHCEYIKRISLNFG